MKVEWTDEVEVLELLDVSTGRCTYCGDPARIPEDVAAVSVVNGKPTPMIVCRDCTPLFAEILAARIKEQMGHRDARRTEIVDDDGS